MRCSTNRARRLPGSSLGLGSANLERPRGPAGPAPDLAATRRPGAWQTAAGHGGFVVGHLTSGHLGGESVLGCLQWRELCDPQVAWMLAIVAMLSGLTVMLSTCRSTRIKKNLSQDAGHVHSDYGSLRVAGHGSEAFSQTKGSVAGPVRVCLEQCPAGFHLPPAPGSTG